MHTKTRLLRGDLLGTRTRQVALHGRLAALRRIRKQQYIRIVIMFHHLVGDIAYPERKYVDAAQAGHVVTLSLVVPTKVSASYRGKL